VLLDDHQAGFLAKEDLIGSPLFDAGSAELIQNGQQGFGASSGILAQASQLGDAGRSMWCGGWLSQRHGQERPQKSAADRQADTFGLGGAGKGSEAVRVDEEGVVTLSLEFVQTLTEGLDLVAELLDVLLGVVTMESMQDGLGVAVESLSREAKVVGALGDLAVRPVENGGGIGDTEFRG
jgi:hypothetical protein